LLNIRQQGMTSWKGRAYVRQASKTTAYRDYNTPRKPHEELSLFLGKNQRQQGKREFRCLPIGYLSHKTGSSPASSAFRISLSLVTSVAEMFLAVVATAMASAKDTELGGLESASLVQETMILI